MIKTIIIGINHFFKTEKCFFNLIGNLPRQKLAKNRYFSMKLLELYFIESLSFWNQLKLSYE